MSKAVYYDTKDIPPISIGKIDHAFARCPKCYRQYRYEWARRLDMMPPEKVTCYNCKTKNDWKDLIFLDVDDYMGYDYENRPAK